MRTVTDKEMSFNVTLLSTLMDRKSSHTDDAAPRAILTSVSTKMLAGCDRSGPFGLNISGSQLRH